MAEYIEETTPAGSGRAKAMRLINAHAIPWQLSDDLELYVTKAAILEMPAVDAVPVVHGRWVMRGGKFRCSVCDAKANWVDSGGTGGFSHDYVQVKSPWCHDCGAKMDGGGDT